jgi:hypothetical protein
MQQREEKGTEVLSCVKKPQGTQLVYRWTMNGRLVESRATCGYAEWFWVLVRQLTCFSPIYYGKNNILALQPRGLQYNPYS